MQLNSLQCMSSDRFPDTLCLSATRLACKSRCYKAVQGLKRKKIRAAILATWETQRWQWIVTKNGPCALTLRESTADVSANELYCTCRSQSHRETEENLHLLLAICYHSAITCSSKVNLMREKCLTSKWENGMSKCSDTICQLSAWPSFHLIKQQKKGCQKSGFFMWVCVRVTSQKPKLYNFPPYKAAEVCRTLFIDVWTNWVFQWRGQKL